MQPLKSLSIPIGALKIHDTPQEMSEIKEAIKKSKIVKWLDTPVKIIIHINMKKHNSLIKCKYKFIM